MLLVVADGMWLAVMVVVWMVLGAAGDTCRCILIFYYGSGGDWYW